MLVSPTGHLALADFNFSAAVAPGARIERHGGTPDYCAPELFDGGLFGRGWGLKADTWSLGLVFYQLYTGSPAPLFAFPAREKDAQRVILRISSEDPLAALEGDRSRNRLFYDLMSKVRAAAAAATAMYALPPGTDILFTLQMLARNPDQRWTAQELKSHPFFEGVQWDDLDAWAAARTSRRQLPLTEHS